MNFYKFDATLDPSVSSFFTTNPLKDSSYSNYQEYYAENEEDDENYALDSYKTNMKKMMENLEVKQQIRCKAGYVLMTLW